MRPPSYAARRRLSPRAAVMLGLAGIMVAIAVIAVTRASVSQAPAPASIHTTAPTPSQTPTSEAGASDAGARVPRSGR